jgi:hypothetical protein
MWISIAIMLVIVFLLATWVLRDNCSVDDPINLTLVLLPSTCLVHHPISLSALSLHRFSSKGSQIKPNSWSILTDFWRFGIVYFDKNKMAVNSKMNESEVKNTNQRYQFYAL